MEPAHKIPLSSDQFAMLGELTAILGIVDDEMTKLVGTLLNVDRKAANTIMGSSKIGDNAAIWAEVIRSRTTNEDILWLVKHADTEIQQVSAGRNDFIHAIFHQPMIYSGGMRLGLGLGLGSSTMRPGTPVARRVKNDKSKPITELPALRDRASRLSCLVAHIAHLATGNPPESSTWLERLAPTLPPRPDTDEAHKAKGRRPPPRSSAA